jgi:ParB family chromosome partitioning protein
MTKPAPTPPLSAPKKHGLGRGLSALLPGAQAPAGPPRGGILSVPLDELFTDVKQPRQFWNHQALEELTASVKAKGILQPILVRRLPEGGYRVVAGERRYRAAREAGLTEVPVIVKDFSEAEAFEVALIENIQREDLNPVEEADAYQRLLSEHGLTQEALAQRLGKERSTIANSLRLLKLPPDVRDQLAAGVLSPGHGKVLLGLPDAEAMTALTHEAAEKGWSVRDLEKAVQKRKEPAPERPEAPKPSHQLAALARRLERLTRTGVDLRLAPRGGGEIVLRFTSEEQGRGLLELLAAGLKEGDER